MEITTTTKKELKDNARKIQPCMRIGKSGITANVIAEIQKQFKKSQLIKIKLLGAVLENIEKKEIGNLLAERTRSAHVQTVGNCVILFQR